MISEEIQALLQERLRGRRRPDGPPPVVAIEGETAALTTPEGRTVSMPLTDLMQRLAEPSLGPTDSGDLIWPDGVKWVISRGGRMLCAHQTPPAIHNLRWIASDSPEDFGPEATYREVRVALPYVIVIAGFGRGPDGALRVDDGNECFFRNEPLTSCDDPLGYPALLNCSKFEPQDGRPLSWICTQHLRRRRTEDPSDNARIRQGLTDLLHCLFGTGFNRSSENHEGASWFQASTSIDPRLATIEAWEAATRERPAFVTEIPWLPVGRSLREVADRMFAIREVSPRRTLSSRHIARLITHHGTTSDGKSAGPTKETE